MFGSNVNNKGKTEKNAKVKEGPCIFPFKYKRETHNACKDFTGKGEICATSVSKFGTLQTYGYCKSTSDSKPKSKPSPLSASKLKAKILKKTIKKLHPRKELIVLIVVKI